MYELTREYGGEMMVNYFSLQMFGLQQVNYLKNKACIIIGTLFFIY